MESLATYALSVPDRIKEDRRASCFFTGEQNVNLSLRFEGLGSFKQSHHILHVQLVDVAGGIRVHVAGRTEHVAAIRKVHNQIRTAPGPDAVCTMVMNHFIASTSEVLSKAEALHPFK